MLKINLNELVAVMAIQSKSRNNGRMMAFLEERLKALKVPYYFDNDNLYATKGKLKKGEFYPCFVAHTDTVHEIKPSFNILHNNGYLIAMDKFSQTGIGGDDKVGIYLALALLDLLDVCKVAFFVDEEIGCIGSGKAHKEFFENVGYVLQADRKGNTGVTESISGMDMISDEFKELIAPAMTFHSRKYVDGMMTDVQTLAHKFDICMMNIECGYYLPHSDKEYVAVQDVENTLNFMYDVSSLCGKKQHPCEHKSCWGKHKKKWDYSDTAGRSSWNRKATQPKGPRELPKRDTLPPNRKKHTYYDLDAGQWTNILPKVSHTYYNDKMDLWHVPIQREQPAPWKGAADFGRYYIERWGVWTFNQPDAYLRYWDDKLMVWVEPTETIPPMWVSNKSTAPDTEKEAKKNTDLKVEELRARIAVLKAEKELKESLSAKVPLPTTAKEVVYCPRCGGEPVKTTTPFEPFCMNCSMFFSELDLMAKEGKNKKNDLN